MEKELIGKTFKQYYSNSRLLSAWSDTVQRVSIQYIKFEHVQKEGSTNKRFKCLMPEIILHGEKHSCAIRDAVFV